MAHSDTVTLVPNYESYHDAPIIRIDSYVRKAIGIPNVSLKESYKSSGDPSTTEHMVVKIQVPEIGTLLLIYNRDRTFMCTMDREAAPKEYDCISAIIRAKGPMGLKGYFNSRLESKTKLVVDISILAQQPF